MMGKIVTVIVDRPIGSYHPDYPDTYYPINYGYIEGTMAADGEEQDAYILGVSEPILKFTGRVIAIIKREDDIEQKWVVAPDGVSFTKEEIEKLTYFQEKFFISKITLL
ncbi:MAG: inorganic diphosphatase [Clostridia bacterium]|nr:inorganic diphosphatase [Clostridia bacterium]